eukprot:TRINITY_DN31470_c0_g1_i1.p1 TRINITY_DN31470_c0_g1~~TRINITY_DN31470_c0_g1_i1.p1  ORF type:complete len:249 (+),score=38.01 TRINITY_DN31470_c0_g1_i1:169-915(+)
MGCKVSKQDRAEFLNVKGVQSEKGAKSRSQKDNTSNKKVSQPAESSESSSDLAEKEKPDDNEKEKKEKEPEVLLPSQVQEDIFTCDSTHRKVSVAGPPIRVIHCTAQGCSVTEAQDGEHLQVYKSTWVRVKYRGMDGFVQHNSLPLSVFAGSQKNSEKAQKSLKRSTDEDKKMREIQPQKTHSARAGNAERYARIRLWLDKHPYSSVPCVVKENQDSFELTQATLQKNMQLIRQTLEEKVKEADDTGG